MGTPPAKPRVPDGDALVDGGSAKSEPERAGKGRFAPGAVGAFVGVAEGPAFVKGSAGAGFGKKEGCGRNGRQGKPGRNKAQRIVEAGRQAAEVPVASVLLAPHGVEGVGDPVEHGQGAGAGSTPGKPSRHAPEQRCQDAVGEVFGNALNAGSGYAGPVQAGGFAADDGGKRQPRSCQIASPEGLLHAQSMPRQRFGGHAQPGAEACRKHPCARPKPLGKATPKPGAQRPWARGGEACQHACRPLPAGAGSRGRRVPRQPCGTGKAAPEEALGKLCQASHPDHGMDARRRFGEKAVEQKRCRQDEEASQCRRHRGLPRPSMA